MTLNLEDLEGMQEHDLHALMDVLPMHQVLSWTSKSTVLYQYILTHPQYGAIFDENRLTRIKSLMSLVQRMKEFGQSTGIQLIQGNEVSLPGFAQHSSLNSDEIIDRIFLSLSQTLAQSIKQYLPKEHASLVLSTYPISAGSEVHLLWNRFDAFKAAFEKLDEDRARQIERLIRLAEDYPSLLQWKDEPALLQNPPPPPPSPESRLRKLLRSRPKDRMHIFRKGLVLVPRENYMQFYHVVTAGRDANTRIFPLTNMDDLPTFISLCSTIDNVKHWNGEQHAFAPAPEEAFEWLETYIYVIRWLARTLGHPGGIMKLDLKDTDQAWVKDIVINLNSLPSTNLISSDKENIVTVEVRQIELAGKRVFVL